MNEIKLSVKYKDHELSRSMVLGFKDEKGLLKMMEDLMDCLDDTLEDIVAIESFDKPFDQLTGGQQRVTQEMISKIEELV